MAARHAAARCRRCRWSRSSGTALIETAVVVARIVLIPPGALAGVPLAIRIAALIAAFLFIRRSAFAGVVIGEAVLVAGTLAFGR
jgi:hypothetical protein